MRPITSLLIWIATITIWYGIFSFYFLSINPNVWDKDGRFGFLVISLIMEVFATALSFDLNKRKP